MMDFFEIVSFSTASLEHLLNHCTAVDDVAVDLKTKCSHTALDRLVVPVAANLPVFRVLPSTVFQS